MISIRDFPAMLKNTSNLGGEQFLGTTITLRVTPQAAVRTGTFVMASLTTLHRNDKSNYQGGEVSPTNVKENLEHVWTNHLNS